MKIKGRSFVQVLVGLSLCLGEVQYVRMHQSADGSTCTVIDAGVMLKYIPLDGKDVASVTKAARTPVAYDQQNFFNGGNIIELYSRSSSVLKAHIPVECKDETQVQKKASIVLKEKAEVRKIISSGDAKNRIDVVFMGDGYTLSEKEKFFADINRLTSEMFNGTTFRSWLPLFNIWAIYVESIESGIGYNGPNNTPFRLYREEGQLRAIFPGNSNYARQVCKLTGVGGCDYPSLIANDDFYGGLGGEFVIATRSVKSGTIVLRHEMGHNFAKVGEEYDSGQVYSGVNSAPSLSRIGWKNWLTGQVREERSIYRILEYPWHNLARGAWSTTFTSDGRYSRWLLSVTVSAAEKQDAVEFLLDGKRLPWKTTGTFDREFYDWEGSTGLTAGKHTFKVRSLKPTTNSKIPQMIASVTLHEFGNEDEFHVDNNYYSAYPTWDIYRRKTYRPTNNKCLMRNMTSNSFCHVCKEGIWAQFLQRVSLIDSLIVKNSSIVLTTPKLGQFRESNRVPGEVLSIIWKLNGVEKAQFEGKLIIPQPVRGKWSVVVKLITPEIRLSSPAWAQDTAEVDIN